MFVSKTLVNFGHVRPKSGQKLAVKTISDSNSHTRTILWNCPACKFDNAWMIHFRSWGSSRRLFTWKKSYSHQGTPFRRECANRRPPSSRSSLGDVSLDIFNAASNEKLICPYARMCAAILRFWAMAVSILVPVFSRIYSKSDIFFPPHIDQSVLHSIFYIAKLIINTGTSSVSG